MQGTDNFNHRLNIINGVSGSINLGDGNDTIEYSTGSGQSTISMGAGNDSISVTTGTGTQNPRIDMGEGSDTININGRDTLSWATDGGTGTDWLIGMGGLGSYIDGMESVKEFNLNGSIGSGIEFFDLSEGRALRTTGLSSNLPMQMPCNHIVRKVSPIRSPLPVAARRTSMTTRRAS